MNTLKIKKLHLDAIIPTRAHETDAGLDIYALEDTYIQSTHASLVPTGIAIDIPKGYEGTIRPRSGKTAKTNLRVQLGTVDSGYNGEIKVIADTLNNSSYLVQAGEKIAQLVIQRVETPQLEIVDQFDTQSERGDKGFGSSDLDCSVIEIGKIDTNQMTEEQIKQLGENIKMFSTSDEVRP